MEQIRDSPSLHFRDRHAARCAQRIHPPQAHPKVDNATQITLNLIVSILLTPIKTLKKVLIVGSGGREHALVKACLASPYAASVVAAPGNGGIADEAACYPLDVEDTAAIVSLAKTQRADFVIIGPEMPLAHGAVDTLQREGISTYGPCQAAAQLEANKAFTKQFLTRHQIPTAPYKTFTDAAAAWEYVQTQTPPIVIKASGLAAGKGVTIATSHSAAQQAIKDMMTRRVFGESGRQIVIETYLEGEEASIHAIVCGKQWLMLPPSQDHKRVGEGDTGLNTGGMGAYAPAPVVTPEVRQRVIKEILEPTVVGLAAEGIPYRGTIYIGIMVTPAGPKVIEFNVRFGDPETQVLLPLLKSDPLELLYACATDVLPQGPLDSTSEHALVIIQAAKGYPGAYAKGEPISLPETLNPGQWIFHAGTQRTHSGQLVTSSGRVLGVTALGPTLQAAADSAYALCRNIHFLSRYYRRDIGHHALTPS